MRGMVKKKIEPDHDDIDTARRIFAEKTDKRANKPLNMPTMDNQIIQTHASAGGKGRLIEDTLK